jgi:hypothetical protein
MSVREIRKEIVRFNNDATAQRLKTYYNEKTYPEILGVSRRELSHSSFLAWIVDPSASHRLGDFGIRRLLEILMTSKFFPQDNEHQKLFDDLITGNFQLTSSKVLREVSIGASGRVDILIEFSFSIPIKDNGHTSTSGEQPSIRIVIENKVCSTEGKDQTNRYYDYYTNLNDSCTNLFVCLTPLSSLDLNKLEAGKQECENKSFIQINYQELVDALLEPAMDQSMDPGVRLVIGQYIQSLSQPSMEEYENDFKRELIMAIGKEEGELLQKFWTGNQKLILAAMYAISSDPNQEEDVRDNVKAVLSSIAKSKDYRTISIRYEGENCCQNIPKSDIGLQTVLLLVKLVINGKIDSAGFDWLREDTSCGFKLLKAKEEVTENEAKYGRYRIKRDPELTYEYVDYYVARSWNITNIDKFISKIKTKFPGITFEIENKTTDSHVNKDGQLCEFCKIRMATEQVERCDTWLPLGKNSWSIPACSVCAPHHQQTCLT